MHNCPHCFGTFHQGHNWDHETSVAPEIGNVCAQLGRKHAEVPNECQGGRLLGLRTPNDSPCEAVKALGGGSVGSQQLSISLWGKTTKVPVFETKSLLSACVDIVVVYCF